MPLTSCARNRRSEAAAGFQSFSKTSSVTLWSISRYTHAQVIGLPPESEDIVIWEYAKREGFAILTADRDFLHLANRLGQPPKLIRLESMNYRTQQAASILQRNAIRMAEFGKSHAGVLVLRS